MSVEDVVAARAQAVAERLPELCFGRVGLLDAPSDATRRGADRGTSAGVAERRPNGRATGRAHGASAQRAARCRTGGGARGLRGELAAIPHVRGQVLGARTAEGV